MNGALEEYQGKKRSTRRVKTLAQVLCTKIRLPDDSGGCWEWGSIRGPVTGYGIVRLQIAPYRLISKSAHRMVYELFVGPIPPGMHLDHVCRNRGCVNPEHLEPVTARENMLRGESRAARAVRANMCTRGHSYDEFPPRIMRNRRGRQCRECDRLSKHGPLPPKIL